MHGVSAASKEGRKNSCSVKQWKQMGAFMHLRWRFLQPRAEKQQNAVSMGMFM